jgi:NitT/TauT family transport system permease protein
MRKLLSRFAPVYAAGVVLALWYVLHAAVDSAAIPSPYETVVNFVRIFPGTLSVHMLASVSRIAAAVLLSLLFGSALGLWLGMSKRADRWVAPVVYLLYPLPKIAFLPILMILFGLGNTPKIILILVIIIFQFVLAARDGVRDIPKELYDSVRSLGLGRASLVRHLVLPACAPKIFTALRIGVGVSISVLFFCENFATTYGIGYFIMNAWAMGDYVEMFSGVLLLGLFGLLAFYLIDLLEGRVCRWVKTAKAAG